MNYKTHPNPYKVYSLTGKDAQGKKVKTTELMGINEASGMAHRIGLTGTVWFTTGVKRYVSNRYYDGEK
jgi:N-acetylneuraminic acid mutarotase